MILVDKLPCSVLITDVSGTILGLNRQITAVTGLDASDLQGQSIDRILPPASRIFLQTHVFPTLLRNGTISECFFQLIGADRKAVPVLADCRSDSYEGRESYVWTFFVALERTRFEAELIGARSRAVESAHAVTTSERFLRSMADALPGLVAFWSKELICKFSNRHYADWFGRNAEEMAGVHIRDVLGEELFNLNDKHIQAALAGEPQQFERNMLRRDGSIAFTIAHYTPFFVKGKVEGFIAQASDVTELKLSEVALTKSQEFLNRTGNLAGVGGWELDIPTGSLTWSDVIRDIHGVPAGFTPDLNEAIGFYTAESRPVLEAAVNEAFSTGKSFDLELSINRVDGVQRFVRAVGSAEFSDGRPVRLSGALQDVTERRKLSAQLAEQHELMRVTLQSIGDAVITTDATGRITWLNPVAERMTGWRQDESQGKALEEIFRIVDETTRAVAPNPVAACLAEGRIVGLADHTILISKDGTEFGIEDSAAPIVRNDGVVLGVVLVFHDVSEQRRLSKEMKYRATHDALTGLKNRTEFEARLKHLLGKSREDRSCHALLYLDLDQFKIVNDTCGHAVGDILLRQVSRLFRGIARNCDTLARLGGDEFGIILENCSVELAEKLAQRICDAMDDFRFVHDGRKFRVGASIGLVPIDARWGDIAAVQKAADSACYAAKDAGRNRFHAWLETDVAMQSRQFEVQWTNRIERALDDGGFVLHAQTIRALSADKPGLHAELLLRMKNDDGSLAAPGAFLPAAERFHLISRIDRWVLREATRWIASVIAVQDIRLISLNLSGRSIGDRAFHAWAFDVLERAGRDICSRICIEITETEAITNLADAAAFIERVRSMGIKVALDDFGAGASSFGYLKSLRVDFMKIDGRFIRDLVTDKLNDVMVRCFVDIAKVVGVQTVAEFVETSETLDRLRIIGVDYAQGFLLGKPEPLARIFDSVPAVLEST